MAVDGGGVRLAIDCQFRLGPTTATKHFSSTERSDGAAAAAADGWHFACCRHLFSWPWLYTFDEKKENLPMWFSSCCCFCGLRSGGECLNYGPERLVRGLSAALFVGCAGSPGGYDARGDRPRNPYLERHLRKTCETFSDQLLHADRRVANGDERMTLSSRSAESWKWTVLPGDYCIAIKKTLFLYLKINFVPAYNIHYKSAQTH